MCVWRTPSIFDIAVASSYILILELGLRRGVIPGEPDQIPEQHQDRDLPDRGEVHRRLLPDVDLEVLLSGHVHADTAVLERVGADLIRSARHRRNHNVRDAETLLERHRARVHGVPRVVLPLSRALCATSVGIRGGGGALGVLLDRVDVDGEHTRAVVREERRERAADDLRAVNNSDRLPIRAIAVRQELIVHPDALEALDDRERRAREYGLDGPRGRHVVLWLDDVRRGREGAGVDEADADVLVSRRRARRSGDGEEEWAYLW